MTCDELLRGERKPPAARAEAAEPSEIAPKAEKQRQRLLKLTLSQYKNRTCIAMGVSVTGVIAARCRALTATDFSEKMLAQAERKYVNCRNVRFAQADITKLDYPDGRFDAVVAANVIHLLDEPLQALRELDRVCRPGGRDFFASFRPSAAAACCGMYRKRRAVP